MLDGSRVSPLDERHMSEEGKESGTEGSAESENEKERGTEGNGAIEQKEKPRPRSRGRSSRRSGTKARQKAGGQAPASPDSEASTDAARATAAVRGGDGGKRSPRGIEAEELHAKAWQLFVVEVAEEGVRMMDSTEAKELAERCFDVANGFLSVQKRARR